LLVGLTLLLASGEKSSTLPGPPGLKMTIRFTGGGNWSEHTTYVRADARRLEYRNVSGHRYGPHIAAIERCDLGEAIELNLDKQEYSSRPYPPAPLGKEQIANSGIKPPQVAPTGPPTLRIEVSTVDTGERSDFFGHTARHTVTTRKETPLEGSHREAEESVMDGWYIDLDARIVCDRRWPENKNDTKKTVAYLTAGNAPPERIESFRRGDTETGFPIEWNLTRKSEFVRPDGTRVWRSSRDRMRVTEFVQGPLEPALFQVPPEFKRVARIDSNEPGKEQNALAVVWHRFVAGVEDLLD
jgi:hypothetical protein